MLAATQQPRVTIAPTAQVGHGPSAGVRPRAAWPRPHQVTREVVIEGLTQAGKTFRPSDWSERLAGALSSFRPPGQHIGAHIGYSPYCVPRVVCGVKCVIVSEALREVEPMAWDFVMHFARDNELRMHERAPGEGE
jgi:hypothetical protein